MSIVIELEFETQIDLDFIEQGIAVHLIRLTASVQLQTKGRLLTAGKGWLGN